MRIQAAREGAVVEGGLTGAALLSAAAARVRSWPSTSASRGRQVAWVAGEYSRALAHADHPLQDASATAEALFGAQAVAAYLELARRGQLRVRRTTTPPPSSEHSEQTRIEVLGLLAEACGVQDVAQLPAQPDPLVADPVAARPCSLLRASLAALADRHDARPGQVRMLAIGAVVGDTAARATGAPQGTLSLPLHAPTALSSGYPGCEASEVSPACGGGHQPVPPS